MVASHDGDVTFFFFWCGSGDLPHVVAHCLYCGNYLSHDCTMDDEAIVFRIFMPPFKLPLGEEPRWAGLQYTKTCILGPLFVEEGYFVSPVDWTLLLV